MTRPTRDISDCTYAIKTEFESPLNHAPDAEWLLKHAPQGAATLLAHTDNGVVWGKIEDSQLNLSGQAFDALAKLEPALLQQLRLFGDQGELFVWRDGHNWRARLLTDDLQSSGKRCFDEPTLQWGDHVEAEASGFTLVAERRQGLCHAVPLLSEQIPFDPSQRTRDRWHPLRLIVRHYLDEVEDGTLVITHSRLVRLTVEAR